MEFGESGRAVRAGTIVGVILAYCIFTVMLSLILTFTNNIPEHWSLLHVAGLTAGISLIGAALRRALK